MPPPPAFLFGVGGGMGGGATPIEQGNHAPDDDSGDGGDIFRGGAAAGAAAASLATRVLASAHVGELLPVADAFEVLEHAALQHEKRCHTVAAAMLFALGPLYARVHGDHPIGSLKFNHRPARKPLWCSCFTEAQQAQLKTFGCSVQSDDSHRLKLCVVCCRRPCCCCCY